MRNVAMTKEEEQDQKCGYEILDEWRTKAEKFSKDFANASYEMGQAQNFFRELCDIYGVGWRVISFEDRVTREEGSGINRIDGFLPGLLLAEMKSTGKNLDDARVQAFGYIKRIKEEAAQGKRVAADEPRYVLVSDFQSIHLYDRDKSETTPDAIINLANFRNHVEKFAFLQGYERIVEQRQEEATVKAAEKLADLHDAIKETGYCGKELESLLVRILFCLFAEDTGLFDEPNLFTSLINSTREDGHDLFGTFDMLFLNLNAKERPATIYPELLKFPYVNGKLFEDRLLPCYFNAASRKAILTCAAEIHWAWVSPAIFGSLFQAIMHFDGEDEKKTAKTTKNTKRRELGAHYTSEKNILKTIKPLFLDKLKQELKECNRETRKLDAYLKKLQRLRILDPACGCGNFLVVSYREIRLLEELALKQLASPMKGQAALFENPRCNVNQFYGIEIDSSAVQIATVALWLVDHQMNMRFKRADGTPFIRLPLTERANIVCGNALQLDWNSVISAKECSYVVGNPPFIGKKEQNAAQKSDVTLVFKGIDGSGVLDYVSAWYVKAASYIKENPAIAAAFVSTNSITQGEQVGILWSYLLQMGIKIHFAHRTFRWSNEGKGVAAVHCVIIGFGLNEPRLRKLFSYPDINGRPYSAKAKNINPYLVDAPNVVIPTRRKPICNAPEMIKGNEATDGGHLVLNEEEKTEILAGYSSADRWIKPFLGGDDFLNGGKRWCLWLKDATPEELAMFPEINKRTEKVKAFRLASPKQATIAKAAVPWLFGEDRQPLSGNYIVVPKVSSERREYMPLGFESWETIINNTLQFVPEGTLYDFGIISSQTHMVWMKAVCGRMKSDYQYSINIVYNNFPWPENLTEDQKQTVRDKAQSILNVRKDHPGKTLADLYGPNMPADLLKAHEGLDKAVDACYGYKGGKDSAARVAFLFKLYEQYVADRA